MGAALILTACSNDELIDVKQERITFNVTTENVTRAKEIATATNLEQFSIYASYTAEAGATAASYINGDTLKKNSDGSWFASSGDRYWPNGGKLTFYALANNDDNSFTFSEGKPSVVTHTVKADVAKQTDLLYAVTTDQSKPSDDSKVQINFRHALSQIAFKAKSVNSTLKITIDSVKLANVDYVGSFTLPTTTTEANSTDAANGTWKLTTGKTSYEVDVVSPAVLKGSSETSIDLSEDSSNPSDSRYMLLIPQDTKAWDKTADGLKTGSYLALKCKIENYVDDNTESVRIWPASTSTETSAYVYVPVVFNWIAGHKYTYTFVFGSTTNGGYDANGNPVLTPISYTVSVSSFSNKTDDNVEVDIKK
jgi:hypothetical protein